MLGIRIRIGCVPEFMSFAVPDSQLTIHENIGYILFLYNYFEIIFCKIINITPDPDLDPNWAAFVHFKMHFLGCKLAVLGVQVKK